MSLPPCKCCLPSDASLEERKQELACCDSTCLEIAAQQECDAQCNDSTTTEDLKHGSTSTESVCCSSETQPFGPGKKPCKKHLKAAH